jgi:hypothetical protein
MLKPSVRGPTAAYRVSGDPGKGSLMPKGPRALKGTPALAAGVSATLSTTEDIADRNEPRRPQPGERGRYEMREHI